jgi:RIO kinase 1
MPIGFRGNVLVMEWIGEERPAPAIVETGIDEKIFHKILEEYRKIYKRAGLVHGDFSEFNILLFRGNPYIIDVSQAIPVYSPAATELLERDINNILRMAKMANIDITYDEIYNYIVKGSPASPYS